MNNLFSKQSLNQILRISACLATIMGLQACGWSATQQQTQTDVRNQELAAREKAVLLREQMAARRTEVLKQLDRKLQGDASGDFTINYKAGQSLFWQPEFEDGSCYAAVKVQPVFKQAQREVLTREVGSQFIVDPVQFESQVKKVAVNVQLKPDHPLYDNVEYIKETLDVELVPAHDVYVEIDPEFVSNDHPIVLRSAHKVWGECNADSLSSADELCVNEQPPEHIWITREELKNDSKVIKDRKAAEIKRVKVRRPSDEWLEQISKDDLHIEYQEIPVKIIKKQASAKRALLPSSSQLVEVQKLQAPLRIEWQPVVCKKDAADYQRKLDNKLDDYFANKKLDEKVDRFTAWQLLEGQAISSPFITFESLKAFGITTD